MTAIDQAGSDAERRRREALEAMASGGSAGVDAYKEAQTQVAGYRDAALNQALGAAAARGAPGIAQGELASIIRAPGDRTLQHLAAAQGTFSADMARRASANDDYFAQAKAAVPAIQAASARDIAWAKAQWESSKAKEKAAADDAQWEQKAISAGLAEMQAEADRQRRFNDIQEQEAYTAAPVANPTFDPVGAALLLATPGYTPAERAQAQQVIAEPMAGATRRTPTGAVVPVTPTLASPHHMGRLLPEAANDIAAEIAAARVPADVQAQRDAYLQVYGEDPRTQALARGMFQPPTLGKQLGETRTEMTAAFFDQYGVIPTPAQAQLFARGLDPFATVTKPQMSPQAVAEQLGYDPHRVLDQNTTITDAETGEETSVRVYDEAEAIFTDYLKQGYSPEEASEHLANDMADQLGRDFPAVRRVLESVYGVG